MSSDMSRLGRSTFHTRVERWECDHNDHWNSRFYGRSFDYGANQMVGDYPSIIADAPYRQGLVRHMLLKKELFTSSSVEVTTAVLDSPAYSSGAILQEVNSHGVSSALAVDYWLGRDVRASLNSSDYPSVSADIGSQAKPRGILLPVESVFSRDTASDCCSLMGTIQPWHCDSDGYLNCEEMFRCVGISSSRYLDRVGFSLDKQREIQVGIMAAEARIIWHAPVQIPSLIRVYAAKSAMTDKSFIMDHYFVDPVGRLVVSVEIAQICVDMQRRKVVQFPTFVQDALLAK